MRLKATSFYSLITDGLASHGVCATNLAEAVIRNVKYTVYRNYLRQKRGRYRGNIVMLNKNLLERENVTLRNVPLSGTKSNYQR
jgi:hypothetical protein